MTDITGLGAAAEAAKGIIGMFFPDKTEQEKAQHLPRIGLRRRDDDDLRRRRHRRAGDRRHRHILRHAHGLLRA